MAWHTAAKLCSAFFSLPISLFSRNNARCQTSLYHVGLLLLFLALPLLELCYYLGAGLWCRENESLRMQHQVCWISSCAAELLIDLPLGTSASVSDSIWNYLWGGDGLRKLQRKWEWHYCRKQTRQQSQRCQSFIMTAINFSSSTSRGSFWRSIHCSL